MKVRVTMRFREISIAASRCVLALAMLLGTLLYCGSAGAQTLPTTGVKAGVDAKKSAASTDGGWKFLGDSESLYLALSIQGSPVSDGPLTLVMRRTLSDKRWTPFSQTGPGVKSLTFWKGQLAAVMGSGSGAGWGIVYEGGSTVGVPLPRGVSLLKLAGTGDRLFALGRSGGGGIEGAGGTGQGSYQVFTLVGRDWVALGGAGRALGQQVGTDVDLLVVGDSLVFGYLDSEGVIRLESAALAQLPAALWVTSTTRPKLELGPVFWTPSGEYKPAEKAVAIRLLDLDGTPAVWADPGITTGGSVYVPPVGYAAGRTFTLGQENGEIAVSAGRIRFFYDPNDDKPGAVSKMFEAVYDYSGKLLGEPVDIGTPIQSANQERIRTTIQGLAMAGLFGAVVLAWHRRSKLTSGQLEAAFLLPAAPKLKRLAAGLIDVSPFLAAQAYVFYTYSEQVFALYLDPKVIFLEFLAIGVVVTHTFFCELFFGRSVGKMTLGLRIVTLTGEKPAISILMIRNGLKFIEMMFPVCWASILVSPLGQSLADGAAGTIVLHTPEAKVGDGQGGTV